MTERNESRPIIANEADKARAYGALRSRLGHLLEGEDDWIAMLATVACELHHTFSHFAWTGFYRVVGTEMLAVGPYQGTHGCLRIPFARGVCGAAARTGRTQRIDDVSRVDDHIACSTRTRSEIVVPLIGADGRAIAVLDIDSELFSSFTSTDQTELEAICRDLVLRYAAKDRSR